MSSVQRVEKDKFVEFTYFIDDGSGNTLERSYTPMSCIFLKHNRLYESIEKLMEGCVVGDEVSALIDPEEGGWGIPDPSFIITQKLSDAPEKYHKVGAEVAFRNEQGATKNFTVIRIDGDTLTLDGNHPFAGKTMKFHVKIMFIRDATEQEISDGIASETDGTSNSSTVH